MPGTWQDSHWSANYYVNDTTQPRKIPTVQAGIKLWLFNSLGGCLTTRPMRQFVQKSWKRRKYKNALLNSNENSLALILSQLGLISARREPSLQSRKERILNIWYHIWHVTQHMYITHIAHASEWKKAQRSYTTNDFQLAVTLTYIWYQSALTISCLTVWYQLMVSMIFCWRLNGYLS